MSAEVSGESVVIGMSLGTENCCVASCTVPFGVAAMHRSDTFNASVSKESAASTPPPLVIAGEDGNRVRPIYAARVEDDEVFGSVARGERIRNPQTTLHCMLPLLAQAIDPNSYGNYPAHSSLKDALRTEDQSASIDCSEQKELKTTRIVDVFSRFLMTVNSHCANASNGRPIQCVALSIPRYVNTKIVHQAVIAAGFSQRCCFVRSDCAGLLAASRDFSFCSDGSPSWVLVLDWGASCCAASLFECSRGALTIHGYETEFTMGGAKIDAAIAESCWQNFRRKSLRRMPSLIMLEGRPQRRLCAAVEAAKIALSGGTGQANLDVEAFVEGIDLRDVLTRSRLEQALVEGGFVAKLDALLKDVCAKAGAVASGVIVPIGGCCRSPVIRAVVTSRAAALGLSVVSVSNEDEICAVGAAFHGLEWIRESARKEAVTLLPDVVDVPVTSYDLCVYVGSLAEPPELAQGTAQQLLQTGELRVVLPFGSLLPACAAFELEGTRSSSCSLILASVSSSASTWCTRPIQLDTSVSGVGIAVDDGGVLHVSIEKDARRGVFEPVPC